MKYEVTSKQLGVLEDIHQICLGIKSRKDEYKNINKAYTVIGAAIFYGPINNEIQCKGQSTKSIESGQKVKDHVYSRNRSGKFFLDNNLEKFEDFFNWYWEKASIYVYVTAEENGILKPFQKEGYSKEWQDTYKLAGIEFVEK